MPRRPRLLTAEALAPVLALAVGVASAGAQPAYPRFELVPRVGGLAPLTELGTALIDPNIQIQIEFQAAVTAGLAVQYNPAYMPVSFRLVVDYPLNGRTDATPAICDIVGGPACRTIGVATQYLALVGDVLIRAGDPETSRFYLVAGAGLKRYEFSDIECEVDDALCLQLDGFTRGQTNPAIHLGLGFTFRIGAARLEAELADYMSWHDPAGGENTTGAAQQDLILTVGLRVGIL